MRLCILLVSLAAAAPGAHAQSQSSSRPALGYLAARTETENRNHMIGRGDRLECLVRKKDGKRVCHTRAAWRNIAAQIAKAEAQPR